MKNIPSTFYRLQLGEHFNLKQATRILPYLKKLGIEGIYCSPYFAANSSHGYDIIDPNRINPLIGSAKDYNLFCKKLKELNLYHIADIVPNHMGIIGNNVWWQDVLKNGVHSKYASFFDVDWSRKKILLPFLETSYEEALKDFKIVKIKNALWLKYKKLLFPLDIKKDYHSIDSLLQKQHYQLVPWSHSAWEVSYRRFFNINELIGLRIEEKKVLEAHHKWIFELLKKKQVNGLRIDHPDGLYDPEGYFNALRKKHKGLIFVEKILGWKEELPATWKVEGTVGYEFVNILTGLFVKKDPQLFTIYSNFIGQKWDFDELLYQNKRFYMKTEMAGDVKFLALRVKKMAPEFTEEEIVEGLYEILACFPVYRTYIRPKKSVPSRDIPYIHQALTKAKVKNPPCIKVFLFLEKLLNLKVGSPGVRDFVLRFQQLCAPIMAKGYEDITLYNYNPNLALNEVGGWPDRGGVSIEEFHTFCLEKKEKWPLGMLTVSTHDTKRSMDTRMQIATLSENPVKWKNALNGWSELNKKDKTQVDGKYFPDKNAEYFLYQTLLGVWPSKPNFNRLWISYLKSIREARVYTSWQHPNREYENACHDFLKNILNKKHPFLNSFKKFQKDFVQLGQYKSLAAVVLQLGCPGIVDVYEGCENFRYLLVDPDNRTPVNWPIKMDQKGVLYQKLLNFRNEYKQLFLRGEYIPLEVKGPARNAVIAFMRKYKNQCCLIAALRFFSTIPDLTKSHIFLSEEIEGFEILSGKTLHGKKLSLSRLFQMNPYSWVFWQKK